MDKQELGRKVLGALRLIAPRYGTQAPRRDGPLREQVDLDSMDWLSFLVELNERRGVDILEMDYTRLATLDDLVTSLPERIH